MPCRRARAQEPEPETLPSIAPPTLSLTFNPNPPPIRNPILSRTINAANTVANLTAGPEPDPTIHPITDIVTEAEPEPDLDSIPNVEPEHTLLIPPPDMSPTLNPVPSPT